MITRKEFNEMSFEEAWEYCCDQSDCFISKVELKDEVVFKINYDDYSLSLELLHALNEYPTAQYWFYVNGTSCNLTPICEKEDLDPFIQIEEGKQKYTICFTGTQVVEVDVDSTMSKKDIEKKVLEQCCPYVESLDWITNSNTDDTLVEYADEADI